MNRLLLRAAYWLVGRAPPPTDADIGALENDAKVADIRITVEEEALRDVYDKEKQTRIRGKGDVWYYDRYSRRFEHTETGLFISLERVLELETADLRLPEKVAGGL